MILLEEKASSGVEVREAVLEGNLPMGVQTLGFVLSL